MRYRFKYHFYSIDVESGLYNHVGREVGFFTFLSNVQRGKCIWMGDPRSIYSMKDAVHVTNGGSRGILE